MSLMLFTSGLTAVKTAPVPEPEEGLQARVAAHRYDAQMTYTQTTDTLTTNKNPSEFWAMKHNIQPTSFVGLYHPIDIPMLNFGRVRPSNYFTTDRWRQLDGQNANIPDYGAAAYSAAGASAFAAVTVGQAKTARTPNFGQQMWNVSNGQLGYDVVTGQLGANMGQELFGLMEAHRDYIFDNTGFRPYCFSYRNGRNDTPEMYALRAIGARNSDASISGPAYTSYGQGLGYPGEALSRAAQVNRASSMRYWDFYSNMGGGTKAQADAYLEQQLLATLESRGWFEDFTHWHTAGAAVGDMYAKTRQVLAGQDVYYADFESTMRYLWARESVQSVSVSGNTVSISWKSFDLPQALTVPVSIRIDTMGTDLQGKDITSSVGTVLRKSANVFVVEVPYNTPAFTVTETPSPVYVDLAVPVISYSVAGTTLTVTTDKPCKVALWKAAKGTAESTLGAPVRSATLKTTHTFTVTTAEQEGDVYIGALSDRDQSAVLGPVDFTKT